LYIVIFRSKEFFMATRIRIELRDPGPNASFDAQDRAFRAMLAKFKKAVNDDGLLTLYKQKQSFESRGQRLRRKRKESLARLAKEERELKYKIKEFFGS
jgi:ribosomal protein S21